MPFSLAAPCDDSCQAVLAALPPAVQAAFRGVGRAELARVNEIRIVLGRPLMVTFADGDRFVTRAGLATAPEGALCVDAPMVSAVLETLTHSSVYAVEESMREGFLTLPGGHRVGLLGTPRLRDGRVDGFRQVVGFNIRINRPIYGAAARLWRHLIRPDGRVASTMILSPPGCGKTTLLRDIVRTLSYGDPARGVRPQRVGVADERSEIAACVGGVPQSDLGPRADVIDQCPKRIALRILLRTMGPQVLATDEVGHPGDVEAILDAAGAGVSVLCTAHGRSMEELWERPALRPLLESQLFERFVILSRRRGPGTVERVVSGTLAKGEMLS